LLFSLIDDQKYHIIKKETKKKRGIIRKFTGEIQNNSGKFGYKKEVQL